MVDVSLRKKQIDQNYYYYQHTKKSITKQYSTVNKIQEMRIVLILKCNIHYQHTEKKHCLDRDLKTKKHCLDIPCQLRN